MVEQHIAEGTLERVPHAPEFSWPVYLVYNEAQPTAPLQHALSLLKDLMRDDVNWQATQERSLD